MNKQEVLKAQSQFVVMRNELIQKSRYELTLTEQKLVLFMVSKITPYDEPNTEYSFTMSDFITVCNLNKDGGIYKNLLKDILLGLKAKPLVIKVTETAEAITSWFNDAYLDRQTDEFRISFSKYLTPYLYNLQTFYTQFCLENVLAMKSKYGVRLYEYLRSIKIKGYKHVITLEELRERCGVTSKYENYKDFRKRILEPALADINTYTDLEVTPREIKEGRRVAKIEFIIVEAKGSERFINRHLALGRDKLE